MRSSRPRFRAVLGAAIVLVAAIPGKAAERELDSEPPPSSVSEIATPIERVFPVAERRRTPLLPRIRDRLEKLPPFFADTQLEARFRTYYLRKDRATDELSEAWAIGGSVYYRSGWLADMFSVELEGFTSRPIMGPYNRDGTFLLAEDQKSYSALGIANAKLRVRGLVLTGYRQYLDLPYLNRQDNRMTPNTYESLTLEKREGKLRLSTGYTWRIKPRNSDEFETMTQALGLEEDRGLAHAGVVWDPTPRFHVGTVLGVLPDVSAGLYAEVGSVHSFAEDIEMRIDAQFTSQHPIGEELLGDTLNRAWNLGIRGSASWRGAVFRLGVSVTSANGGVRNLFGSSPSYVDLMQRSFNLADEKALLVSVSYDFAGVGAKGLTAIVNFVAGFDGNAGRGRRRRSQEVDLTVDYRIEQGFLDSFWLRVRGSFVTGTITGRNGTDVRVILRYDFPVI